MKIISSHPTQKTEKKKKNPPVLNKEYRSFSSGNKKDCCQNFFSERKMDFSASSGKISSVPLSGNSADFQKFLSSAESFCRGNISSGKISSALMEADHGALASQAALFHAVLEKEPVITAHLQTRCLAVMACDWRIAGTDTHKGAFLTSILQKAKLHTLLRHLLDALAFGCSSAAILWDEGGSSIRAFQPIGVENLLFDASGEPSLRSSEGKIIPLSNFHPSQFVFHFHKLKAGPSGSGGLLRPLLWLYFFKHYALRDRARYLEKFGIPFIIARINQEDFQEDGVRRAILTSLNKIASDGSGVISGDAQIQTLSPGVSAAGEYQSFLEYIDKLFALLILGQTASSSSSSGFSKGQIQENVRRDILEADCRALMETVNSQILRPLEFFLYGTEGEFTFQMDFSSPENLTEKAQIVKLLSESGFTISPEWISHAFNIQLTTSPAENK